MLSSAFRDNTIDFHHFDVPPEFVNWSVILHASHYFILWLKLFKLNIGDIVLTISDFFIILSEVFDHVLIKNFFYVYLDFLLNLLLSFVFKDKESARVFSNKVFNDLIDLWSFVCLKVTLTYFVSSCLVIG